MAPTKRKRQTKHRGNAAGRVETRGRTGRKPTTSERGKGDARARRLARLDTPPTWRSAINRALVATALFLVLLIFFFRHQQLGPKLGIAAFMLLVYRRRQARKLREQAARREP